MTRTIGIASFDDLEGGVEFVPDEGVEASVHYFVEVAGVEADGYSIFATTSIYLEEIVFLQRYVIKDGEVLFVFPFPCVESA